MSIKIHHGPNGSYKTAGSIEDLARAYRAGRLIITNIRGLSDARLRKALKIQPTEQVGEVWHISTEGEGGLKGRWKLATFFQWAPPGAFIFVDECQTVWLPTWRAADVRRMDWPKGEEDADKVDRPPTFEVAFQKHRHWNWDLVLTTQDIDWVRDEIRSCADGAYRHMNAAFIGLKGRYVEVQHHPRFSGLAASHAVSKVVRKVPKYVFQCYESTATGKVSDSIAGKSLLANPRVMLLGAVLAAAIYWGWFHQPAGLGDGLFLAHLQPNPSRPRQGVAAGRSAAAGPGGGGGDGVSSAPRRAAAGDPFRAGVFVVEGSATMGGKTAYLVAFYEPGRDPARYVVGAGHSVMGMTFTPYSDCLLKVRYEGGEAWARCGAPIIKADNSPASSGPSAAVPSSPAGPAVYNIPDGYKPQVWTGGGPSASIR